MIICIQHLVDGPNHPLHSCLHSFRCDGVSVTSHGGVAEAKGHPVEQLDGKREPGVGEKGIEKEPETEC